MAKAKVATTPTTEERWNENVTRIIWWIITGLGVTFLIYKAISDYKTAEKPGVPINDSSAAYTQAYQPYIVDQEPGNDSLTINDVPNMCVRSTPNGDFVINSLDLLGVNEKTKAQPLDQIWDNINKFIAPSLPFVTKIMDALDLHTKEEIIAFVRTFRHFVEAWGDWVNYLKSPFQTMYDWVWYSGDLSALTYTMLMARWFNDICIVQFVDNTDSTGTSLPHVVVGMQTPDKNHLWNYFTHDGKSYYLVDLTEHLDLWWLPIEISSTKVMVFGLWIQDKSDNDDTNDKE